MSTAEDIRFMKRCFQLARKGLGNTSPNPLVGAVIVHEGVIIGEGYHKKYGGPHAEPNAIASVQDPSLLSQSTLYVNLEPCNHFGKTPPCADLLVQHNIQRVVICNTDPNPQVNGSGIEKLKKAGITVTTGVLEAEGKALNHRFFSVLQKKRPYIILKWAQTANGYLNHAKNQQQQPLQISSETNKQLVHSWRAKEDAILIGARTYLNDAPFLNTREVMGKSPTPIVWSTRSADMDFSNWSDKKQFILISEKEPEIKPHNMKWIELERDVSKTLQSICALGIQSILIEGGSKTLSDFIEHQQWDEARVYQSTSPIGAGVSAPSISTSFLLNKLTKTTYGSISMYSNTQSK